MKTLTPKALAEIRTWVYRNARPLDLSLWQYSFEQGGREAVLTALSFYQNPDGGFGHALEPDNWNPHSSPYVTLNAVDKLQAIGFTDTSHPIFQGILRYFESGAHAVAAGWLFNIPTNNEYPHAPWLTYDPMHADSAHKGITAEIVAFALTFAHKESAFYCHACALADQLLAVIHQPNRHGDMGLSGYCTLWRTICRLGLTDRFDTAMLFPILKQRVDAIIERDTTKWSSYCVRPSQFIKSPDSPFYPGNEAIVEQELDYLIDTRIENGGWPIAWQWGSYPKEFAIAENWWKGDFHMGTTGKVRFLHRFGRIESIDSIN